MKHCLLLISLLFFLAGCKKEKIASSTNCSYPGVTLTRTDESATQVPAIVVAVKDLNQTISYQIKPSPDHAWAGCNLPQEFAKDSLKVFISGYFLTFPGMETMNISPVPFEVTEVRPRK